MFEPFTDQARAAVVLAQEEARLLQHNYIGTEHLLLGLLALKDCGKNDTVVDALNELGITLENVRAQVEEIIGKGGSTPSGHIPFTPRAKKVLELALRECLQMGMDEILATHILLGLCREGEGVAAQIWTKMNQRPEYIRAKAIEKMHQPSAPARQPVTETPDRTYSILARLLQRQARGPVVVEAFELDHQQIATALDALDQMIAEQADVPEEVHQLLSALRSALLPGQPA